MRRWRWLIWSVTVGLWLLAGLLLLLAMTVAPKAINGVVGIMFWAAVMLAVGVVGEVTDR